MTSPKPLTELTPQQYLDVLFAADPEVRLRMAWRAIDNATARERGDACEWGNHEGRLDQLEAQRDRAWIALGQLHEAVDQMSEAAEPGVRAVLLRFGEIVGFHRDGYCIDQAAAREALRAENREQARLAQKARDDAAEAAALADTTNDTGPT